MDWGWLDHGTSRGMVLRPELVWLFLDPVSRHGPIYIQVEEKWEQWPCEERLRDGAGPAWRS